jgi:nucleotidyltransferase/DNA polymerase involved in DNA repair
VPGNGPQPVQVVQRDNGRGVLADVNYLVRFFGRLGAHEGNATPLQGRAWQAAAR